MKNSNTLPAIPLRQTDVCFPPFPWMGLCYLCTSHLKCGDENAFIPSFTTNLEQWRNQNSLYSISIILRIKSLFLHLFCIYGILTPCKHLHRDAQDSRRPEESVCFLRTGITDGCELPCVLGVEVLREQPWCCCLQSLSPAHRSTSVALRFHSKSEVTPWDGYMDYVLVSNFSRKEKSSNMVFPFSFNANVIYII